MLIWINGPFGVGKTTAATGLVENMPKFRLFDPESIGSMLRANLADLQVTDFQDYPAWRRLVPIVATELMLATNQDLVAVQTVLREHYWTEIEDNLRKHGQTVRQVLLDTDSTTLRQRIEADQVEVTARDWRLAHLNDYLLAKPWLTARANLVIDTTTLNGQGVINCILSYLELNPDAPA